MLVETFARSPQPIWQKLSQQQIISGGLSPPVPSFNQSDDDPDPNPPPAAPALAPWPRVFPGL